MLLHAPTNAMSHNAQCVLGRHVAGVRRRQSDPIPGTTIASALSSCEKWPREQDPTAFPYVPSLLFALCLHLEVACRWQGSPSPVCGFG